MTMKIGYFPGCSLLGSSREYDESMRASAKAIGLDLQEIPDWNCCGASAAHNLNKLLSIALPARTLALAEKAGLEEILVPCSACYSRLLSANAELAEDEELRKKVADIIEMEVKGTSRILNVIEALDKVITSDIKEKIVSHFDYKVACYYGCYLVRPPKLVQPDRVEDPQGMEAIMKRIGAEPIDWAFKVECCGAGFSVSRTDLVGKLSGRIVEDAVDRGAEAIIVACPMCHSNLDLRRPAIEKYTGKKYDIPVMYITQAIGLAMGIDEKTLGLHRHMVTVKLPSKEAAPATS
jgi:heterodisulfide reductase subunit B2